MFHRSKSLEYYGDDTRQEYGGKGANLILMDTMDLPVPPAYLLFVDWSTQYNTPDREYVMERVNKNYSGLIAGLEQDTGLKFGPTVRSEHPLLVSVRSGAAVSMPGMMDTVLNVGLNDISVRALSNKTNLEFAWDSYRRFIQSFATVVLGHPKESFQSLVDTATKFCPTGRMTVRMSQHLVAKFKELCPEFPQDVKQQLVMSIEAVFKSWNSERAKAYRELENIDTCYGTGVVIQQMVFGNMNANSGTGVIFTRNPVTGTGEPYGDFLVNAQGEDVVDGSHQTLPIDSMATVFSTVYDELREHCRRLEIALGDMCDIEFTIEDGRLWILQVRTGKRSTAAARRIPLHLLYDGVISIDKAMELIPFGAVESPAPITNTDGFTLAGKGLVASEGDIEGVMAFSSKSAVKMAEEGKTVILVTQCTSPEDMPGIIAAVGLLTLTGGLVSHAAVVARSWDKPCIVGASSKTEISFKESTWNPRDDSYNVVLIVGDQRYEEGDSILLRTSEKGAFYLKQASS